MGYICPICGWNKLLRAPYFESGVPTFDCCPSCGFEFGYDDSRAASDKNTLNFTKEQMIDLYRKEWIDEGMEWWSKNPAYPRPSDWSPKEQLLNIGIEL